jgi:hypothetical protein
MSTIAIALSSLGQQLQLPESFQCEAEFRQVPGKYVWRRIPTLDAMKGISFQPMTVS